VCVYIYNLAVGYNVTSRAHEADRVNPLSRRQTSKQPNRPEVRASVKRDLLLE